MDENGPLPDALAAPDEAIESYWVRARNQLRLNTAPAYFGPTTLEVVRPPAWALSTDPVEADRLLHAVVSGEYVVIATPAGVYDDPEAPRPAAGDLEILLDGRGHPRALVVTTDVALVAADALDQGHTVVLSDPDAAASPQFVVQHIDVAHHQ